MSEDRKNLAAGWLTAQKTRSLDEVFRFLITQAEPESIDLLVEAFDDEEAEQKLGSLLDFFVSALARRESVAAGLDIRLAQHPNISEALERAGQRAASHPEEVEELRTQTEDFLGPDGWKMRRDRLRGFWQGLVDQRGSEAKAVSYLWHTWSGLADDHEEHDARIIDVVKRDPEEGFAVVEALLEHQDAVGFTGAVACGPLKRLIEDWPEETLLRLEDGDHKLFRQALDRLDRGDFDEKTWNRIVRLRRS